MASFKDSAVRLYDGLTNLLTGMGGSLDTSRASFYTAPMLTRDQIDNSYRTSWLSAIIHDAVPLDSVRNWRTWSAPSDVTAKIEREERRLGVKDKLAHADTLSRLYGGAVMMMGVRNDDPAEPLDVATVREGDLKYIHTISRHEITVPSLVLDPGSPRYGEPMEYQINAGNGRYARVDASRIIRFVPKKMPEHIALGQASWGDPLLYSINQAIMDADTASGSFSAIVSKSKTDTVEIPNLIEIASTQAGEDKLKQRIQLMKAFEGLFSVRILAGAKNSNEVGEKWSQWQANFSNMPEMQTMFWQAVAGASGLPLTRLLGTSPAGLNATGEADTAAYYELISARQEMAMRPRLEMLDEVLLRSATGQRDIDWWFSFAPLAVDSAAVKAETSSKRATAIKTLADSQAVPSDVLMKLARGQIIDSGDYPGAEDAYAEYDAAGEVDELDVPPAENDNEALLNSVTEGLAAQGKSASVAARDAVALLDSTPRPLYVCRMVLNRDDLQAWATEQGLGELQPDLHTTILYSRQPVDWIEMGNDWGQFGKKEGEPSAVVPEGGPRVVEPLGDRGAVLMFAATDLQYRHEEMVRKGASHDYPSYVPHVSLFKESVDLSRVTPYRGRIDFGPEIFSEIKEDIQNVE